MGVLEMIGMKLSESSSHLLCRDIRLQYDGLTSELPNRKENQHAQMIESMNHFDADCEIDGMCRALFTFFSKSTAS